VLLLAGGPLAGQPKDPPRAALGKVVSANGSVLERPAGKAKWQALKKNASVYTGDTIVGMPGAMIDSQDGSVRLSLLADLDELSPFPGLESAIILSAPEKKFDFNFTLDRGRVDLTNLKKEGEVRVRARFHDEDWDLTLKEPGTRVVLELYGRWPRGVYWSKDDKKPESPTLALVLVAVKGTVELRHDNRQHAMHAPPGPAIFHWDSVNGESGGPERLEKLPAWTDPDAAPTAIGKRRRAVVRFLEHRLFNHTVEGTITECMGSSDQHYRKAGIILMGATDDLPGLIGALSDAEHHDVRDNAIMTLRHWIGRGPGQDKKLYDALQKDKKYSPVQADQILHLLHSFGLKELGRPETYEALIEYLRHDKLAIRELAEYHLYRLVPEGKKIPYNPTGTKAELDAAYKEWKKLVPDGMLPPKPKDPPKE